MKTVTSDLISQLSGGLARVSSINVASARFLGGIRRDDLFHLRPIEGARLFTELPEADRTYQRGRPSLFFHLDVFDQGLSKGNFSAAEKHHLVEIEFVHSSSCLE